MKLPVHLVFVAVLLRVKAFYYCRVENEISRQWQRMHHDGIPGTPCCEVTREQWKLISWYFLRVGSFLEVTEVVREMDLNRRKLYMSHFLKDLYLHTGLEYYTYRVDFSYREELRNQLKPYSHTYQWHAELSKGGNSTYWVEDDGLQIRSGILSQNWGREDEPDFGSVVLAQDIEIIDYYLNGEPRHPFMSKRAHYIILIYRQVTKDWDKWASSILSKLWKIHGILNAIILSSCKHGNVGFYDPFVNTRSLNIPNIDEWGIFRCFPIKYIDFNDNWLVQKEYSLNNFPITFSIFERYPTMVPNSTIPRIFAETQYARAMKTSSFGGVDGFLLGHLAEEIDFTVNAIQPADDDTYGRRVNNNFTGTLADVLDGRADVAFNSRYLFNYSTSNIEFMAPILGDKVCVISPLKEKYPQWKAIFRCFDIYFWFIFVLITFVSSVCFALLKYYQEKHEKRTIRDTYLYKDFKHMVVEDKICVRNIFFTTWKVMLGVAATLPFGSVERFLVGSCLLANVIISGSFESSLYTAYTSTSKYKKIDTLVDLNESGLNISVSSPLLRNIFGNSQTVSEVLQLLKEKTIIENYTDGWSPLERVANWGDICSLDRYSDVIIRIKTQYLNEDGSPKLHVVKECPRHFFFTYVVQKDWPLLPRFNRVLLRFSEGGFALLWYLKTEEAFIMHSTADKDKPTFERRTRKPFSLSDIQTPFYFLVIGIIISSVVFLFETFILPPNRFRRISKYFYRLQGIEHEFEEHRLKIKNSVKLQNFKN